ncbi:hypothetical protein TNCV_316661 [Trichonephila clavipes]|nr:hypothetical protein TNCV_316661 [Trichonephila clavipes]
MFSLKSANIHIFAWGHYVIENFERRDGPFCKRGEDPAHSRAQNKAQWMRVCSKGTTNKHRIWGGKPRLVDENCDSSSHREDDEPVEWSGQKNEEIWIAVVGLKKYVRLQISHSSGEPEHDVLV